MDLLGGWVKIFGGINNPIPLDLHPCTQQYSHTTAYPEIAKCCLEIAMTDIATKTIYI